MSDKETIVEVCPESGLTFHIHPATDEGREKFAAWSRDVIQRRLAEAAREGKQPTGLSSV